jgi:hypothetical protein
VLPARGELLLAREAAILLGDGVGGRFRAFGGCFLLVRALSGRGILRRSLLLRLAPRGFRARRLRALALLPLALGETRLDLFRRLDDGLPRTRRLLRPPRAFLGRDIPGRF